MRASGLLPETKGETLMEKRTAAIIAGAAAAASLIGLLLYSGISIRPDTDSVITLYGNAESPVPGVSASLFGMDVSNRISVTDTTDITKVGTYQIRYTCKILGIPLRTVSIDSVVADMEPPEITMDEGVVCFTKTGEDWAYPAYAVKDNYDPANAVEVTLAGAADRDKPGIYNASLKACDTSGNCTLRSLRVVVGDAAEEDFKPENFDLDALDPTHYLLKPGTEPASDAEFRDLYWVGDSNILNLGKYDGLPSDRVIARYAMSPSTFELPIYYRDTLVYKNAGMLIGELKPKRILIMMGEAEAGSGDPLQLADDYAKCLDELKKASPSTEIIVSAILPIRKGSTEAAASQEQINRVNYCLLQMCRQKKIPMLCPDKWIKDDSGYGISEYYLDDGFHLKGSHFEAFTDYVRYCLNH